MQTCPMPSCTHFTTDKAGLWLFFLRVYTLPLPKTASSLGTMSHFFCILPWAGWVHWQSLQILVELNCHSFSCKFAKEHTPSQAITFSGAPTWVLYVSLLSLFHAAPPGGQWLEFVMKTNLSQQKSAPLHPSLPRSRRAVQPQMTPNVEKES